MRYCFIIITLSILTLHGREAPAIIPRPVEMVQLEGYFSINQSTQIIYTPDCKQEADYLQKILAADTNPNLVSLSSTPVQSNFISLEINKALHMPEEGYLLIVTESNIHLQAATAHGIFNGIQTLRQLADSSGPLIPAVRITDYPRFPYRGMHLDVARHFFNADFIKKYIDLMAELKMNHFHWHLTDEQGWRLEIKKYPNLTQTGGFRKETLIGHSLDFPERYDGIPYGGFYTQQEIRDIVRYAKERHITIIPEIEMPGHSRAALAAYPDLGCTGGPYDVNTRWRRKPDVFCAGREFTFEFLENVLDEVMALFPGLYIHIGGDECLKERWQECEFCQNRIRTENLKDEHELQSYFITRIEKYLNSKGRHIIGWDEILEGGLAPNATVMSWRGFTGGITAAKSGHNVIMAPVEYTYFNTYQAQPEYEFLAFQGYLPLNKVYRYDPVPENLPSEYHHYIIGSQGNIWTEYIKNTDQLEYMLNPRLAAMAEVLWTPREMKNWQSFQNRLGSYLNHLDNKEIKYSSGSFKIDITTARDTIENRYYFLLNSEQPDPVIRFTTDGTVPTTSSQLYTSPVFLKNTTQVTAAHFQKGKIYRGVFQKTINLHVGMSATLKVFNFTDSTYNQSEDNVLIDGLYGEKKFDNDNWQIFENSDFSVHMDFATPTEISDMTINFAEYSMVWASFPEFVTVSISDDGENFHEIQKIMSDTIAPVDHIKTFSVTVNSQKIKALKIFAKNRVYKQPALSSLLVDEIFVK
ncbi:MAG: family 20 glycosylhydrolase [Candidatus Marinimicrobia bacterium]|nr:family 20 glycosylhydrolase [Candidatus Neomarinimicrobiota bacterium]